MKKHFLFLFILPILTLNFTISSQPPPECEKRRNKTQSFNYLGTSLILHSEEDIIDLLLCPGDTFGNLNDTHVTIQNCNLTLYHKDQVIWSKGRRDYLASSGHCSKDDDCFCAYHLKRDGNLILYQHEVGEPQAFLPSLVQHQSCFIKNLDPIKTELRLEGQELQILLTLKNETQRLFYIDEDHQEFVQDVVEPVKIAEKFITKSHSDEDKTILRRNEYIGDINGKHLILQSNCELHLLDKNETIWYLDVPFRKERTCTLNVARDNKTIEISRNWKHETSDSSWERKSIMKFEAESEVAQSKITFDDSEPVIIQTLKNGSEFIFNGGRLKRELTQIAQTGITLRENAYQINRMGYIGNLTGLHLILEQNCSFILANGNEKLWEFESEPQNSSLPIFECFVEITRNGAFSLHRPPRNEYQLMLELSYSFNQDAEFVTAVELTLKNNKIIIKKERRDRSRPEIFIASQKTHGHFFQFLEGNSVTTPTPTKFEKYYEEILPKMGFIGDWNGVYAILDKNCNWILYNKTQVLWESGSRPLGDYSRCSLILEADGEVKILGKTSSGLKKTLWSASDSPAFALFDREVLNTELSIKDGELWMNHVFRDGTRSKYRAIKGANHFAHVSRDTLYNSEL